MILDWLSSGKSVAQNPQRDTEKKHLLLQGFPRRFILDLVQQIKDTFNDDTWLFSDFVITFTACVKSYDYCLAGDHKFTSNKTSTNERLSFFTQSQFCGKVDDSGCVYRLWCRKVENESKDLNMATYLQNLEERLALGISLADREFYHINYPAYLLMF